MTFKESKIKTKYISPTVHSAQMFHGRHENKLKTVCQIRANQEKSFCVLAALQTLSAASQV